MGAFSAMTFVPILERNFGPLSALLSPLPIFTLSILFLLHSKRLSSTYRPDFSASAHVQTHRLWTARKFPATFFMNIFVAVNSIGLKYLFLSQLPNLFVQLSDISLDEVYIHIGLLGVYGFAIAPCISLLIRSFQLYMKNAHRAYAMISSASTFISMVSWILYQYDLVGPAFLIHSCYLMMPFTETSKISAAYRTIKVEFISLGARVLSFGIYCAALLLPIIGAGIESQFGPHSLIWTIIAWLALGFISSCAIWWSSPSDSDLTEKERKQEIPDQMCKIKENPFASPSPRTIHEKPNFERQQTYCEKVKSGTKTRITLEPQSLHYGKDLKTYQRSPSLSLEDE